MLSDDLSECSSTVAEVERMIEETMISLLRCFDRKRSRFPPSLIEESAPPGQNAPWRDSATVLCAMEKAAAKFNHDDLRSNTAGADAFFAAVLEKNAAPSGISYEHYYNHVFDPCLSAIADGDVVEILGKMESGKGFKSFQNRDPFTCARVLGLLNIYGSRKSHGEVYMQALSRVLEGVTQLYPPHYAYGGASITGDESHAFVAYHCLQSLDGIAQQLRTRSKGHKQLAALLEETHQWINDPDSPARFASDGWKDRRDQIEAGLHSLKRVVGLEEVAKGLLQWLPDRSADDSTLKEKMPEVCKRVGELINPALTDWLEGFSERVRKALKAEDESEKAIRASDFVPRDPIHPPPGFESIVTARNLVRKASVHWRRAFLEGMQHVLTKIREAYKKVGGRSEAPDLVKAIRTAGTEWGESAALTAEYVSILSKWADAEMERQLALYAVPSQLNFDAAQLAFCLRIHHEFARQARQKMAAKALDVLHGSQSVTGTWPIGVALATDPETGASVYPTNLEIISAIAPLIAEHGGIEKHGEVLSRVFDWLKANRREIEFGRAGVKGWPADYIRQRGRIDVWATALALEFLVLYRDLILDGMVQQVKRRGYDVQLPGELKKTLHELTDAQLGQAYDQRTTTTIIKKYVEPFKTKGSSSHSSMVLYGPPGTAKTTLAEGIAKELGWALLTITPSDFVKEGIERSEQMARTIFSSLLELRRFVILFDECDEMFRDRNDTSTTRQDIGMLRFIVPGMLPKLQRLNKHGRTHSVIFVIATNYFERLDKAIVRPGRIDRHFLIPPYDQKSRVRVIGDRLRDKKLDMDFQLRARLALVLSRWTGGWVWTELDRLVERFAENYKELAPQLKDATIERATDILRKHLGVKGPAENLGYTFGEGLETLGRALDPGKVYGDREAEDEQETVRKICSEVPF